jgi:hypothetical protein
MTKRGPDQSREAEHHGEQPDDAPGAGLICEHHFEAGKVDLRLFARRRLEPHLEAALGFRRDLLHGALNRGIAAAKAALAQLPQEPDSAQTRIGCQTFTQIRQEFVGAPWSAGLCAIVWRIHPAGDVFTHRLTVDTELTRDGGGAEPLPVQVQDHHELPKSNH